MASEIFLPADSFIRNVPARAARLFEIHKVDDNLFCFQLLTQCVSRQLPRTNDDDLRLVDCLFDTCVQQRTYVRNNLFDILAVGPNQTSEGNVFVPNLDLPALAQQPLDQANLWTLSQVIRR